MKQPPVKKRPAAQRVGKDTLVHGKQKHATFSFISCPMEGGEGLFFEEGRNNKSLVI